MRRFVWVPVLTVLSLLTPVPRAIASEHAVAADTVPSAVRDALRRKYGQADRISFTRERSRGVVTYEATITAQGRSIDVEISADGQIKLEEERISRGQLPAAVVGALMSSPFGRDEIGRVERVIDHEVVEAPRFEILVRDRRALWELTYDREGHLKSKERMQKPD